ncbi:MAG: hypothetical protein FVQ77_15370 [Cytophagales bacterium]|nr:hypothetical protein [Cytophagales bacterium]
MEALKEELINERDFFKIYSFFIGGLTTGIVSFLLRDDFYSNKIVLILLVIGFIFLIFVSVAFIRTYISIKKITKRIKRL